MATNSVTKRKFKKAVYISVFIVGTFLVTSLGMAVLKAMAALEGEGASGIEEAAALTVYRTPAVVQWGFLSAAIVTGVGSLAAGIAVGYVGAAAMGAIGEKPELAGRALIFVGLAEGIAIYGLIIAIMILGKI